MRIKNTFVIKNGININEIPQEIIIAWHNYQYAIREWNALNAGDYAMQRQRNRKINTRFGKVYRLCQKYNLNPQDTIARLSLDNDTGDYFKTTKEIKYKNGIALNNPYVSNAQRKMFHVLEKQGKISSKVVKEFDNASRGLKLPEYVNKNMGNPMPSYPTREEAIANYATDLMKHKNLLVINKKDENNFIEGIYKRIDSYGDSEFVLTHIWKDLRKVAVGSKQSKGFWYLGFPTRLMPSAFTRFIIESPDFEVFPIEDKKRNGIIDINDITIKRRNLIVDVNYSKKGKYRTDHNSTKDDLRLYNLAIQDAINTLSVIINSYVTQLTDGIVINLNRINKGLGMITHSKDRTRQQLAASALYQIEQAVNDDEVNLSENLENALITVQQLDAAINGTRNGVIRLNGISRRRNGITDELNPTYVLDSFLIPFAKTIDYVLEKPLSKKMPRGFRANRNGYSSIVVWCNEFSNLTENYNKINNHSWVIENQDKITRVYRLMDELENQGLLY